MAKLSAMIAPMEYSTPGSPAVDPSEYDDEGASKAFESGKACATCKKPMPEPTPTADQKISSTSLAGPLKGAREMAPAE